MSVYKIQHFAKLNYLEAHSSFLSSLEICNQVVPFLFSRLQKYLICEHSLCYCKGARKLFQLAFPTDDTT